jgi:dimethylhistidine N-methyltransferase
MQSKTIGPFRLFDAAPTPVSFRDQVIAGLSAKPKWIASKFFYDRTGSRLFEEICDLAEYYLTRTELSILRASAGEMAAAVGARPLLVELGSGSGLKTRLLLAALEDPAAYVPVDIAREELIAQCALLTDALPTLELLPVCADYTQPFQLPVAGRRTPNVCFYFPGSTIGNLEPPEAIELLRHLRRLADGPCKLLLGVDLKKDPVRLQAAYDDARGITGAFNLNLLERINRELGGDFALDRFRHQAFYDAAAGRIEMHLVSTIAQTAHINGNAFAFAEGETIRTEHSYKYLVPEVASLAEQAGFEVRQSWMDSQKLFSVLLLHAS